MWDSNPHSWDLDQTDSVDTEFCKEAFLDQSLILGCVMMIHVSRGYIFSLERSTLYQGSPLQQRLQRVDNSNTIRSNTPHAYSFHSYLPLNEPKRQKLKFPSVLCNFMYDYVSHAAVMQE